MNSLMGGFGNQQFQGMGMSQQEMHRQLQILAMQQQRGVNQNYEEKDYGPIYKFTGDNIEISKKRKNKKTVETVLFDPKNPLHINAKLDFIHEELKKADKKHHEDWIKLVDRRPRFGWKK